jgi:hypothetical protein
VSLFVFLGPTMPVEEARRLCAAEYLPPVSMGDVYALMERRPATIAIIDGTFQSAPAVWHKEILYALARGVRVIGSSSMGALRAAELHTFGMEGVGAIYEAFRDGVYNDDDEVAVAHAAGEHGYRALSDAMVNIRAALAEARTRGLVGAATADRLIAQAKGVFYPGRSWPALFHGARDAGLPADEIAALEAYVRAERPNQKRDDAIRLLRALAAGDDARDRQRPPFTFEASWFWKKMIETERQRRDAQRTWGAAPAAVSQASLVRHVRLFSPQRADLLRSAHLLHLLDRATDLGSPDGGAAERGDVIAATLERLEQLWDEAAAAHREEVDRLLPVELRRRGLLDEIAREVDAKWRLLFERGLTDPGLQATGLDEQQLLEWLTRRCGLPPTADAQELAASLGLTSADELIREAAAEYLASRSMRNEHR